MSDHARLDEILHPSDKLRDAVHIAIAPVVAAVDLNPGEHIGITKDGASNSGARKIGVVSPFLKKRVQKGETFYMLLYPGSITSLRHEWTHPDFEKQEVAGESEKWLRWFASYVGMSYSNLLEIGREMTKGSAYVGDDDNQDRFYEYKDRLVVHMENVLGIHIDGENVYFSCAC